MTYQIQIELSNADILAACQYRIEKMFADHSGHFNICAVWEVCDLLKIEYMRDTEVGKFINLFHCVDFSDIAPEQLEKLKRICFGLVGMEVPKPKTQAEQFAENINALSKAVQSTGFSIGEPEPYYHEFELVENPAL